VRSRTMWVLMCCLLMLTLLTADIARGQALGPGVRRGRLEIGYAHNWFHRDLRSELTSDFDWEVDLLYLRCGLHERLTVSAEGFIWEYDEGDRFPDRKYRTYHVGCGALLSVYEFPSLRIALAANYSERFWFDTSRSRYHKRTRSVVVAIQIGRAFSIAEGTITAWGGPAYVSDKLTDYPWGSYEGSQYNSFTDFGAVFGIDFLLWGRIHILPYLVYADYLQPRMTAGYRF
jgi:hypothetical protein